MASPMAEGRVDPHKKAHFSLHISDLITKNDGSLGSYSSVKYNHKPPQTTSSRTTTLTPSASNQYSLKLADKEGEKDTEIFKFTGQKTAPKKSYVLVFDPSSQKATLEPLSSTYTFNLASRNGKDMSSSHPKIYPKKQKHDSSQDAAADDLFADDGQADHENEDPDPNNPYDFRHFLSSSKDKEKRGDESEYAIASSPDYRTGTGSAINTPLLPARKPAAPTSISSKQSKLSQSAPKPRKRKSPEAEPVASKKAVSKKATPAVRLDRRASTHPKPDPAAATKANRKAPKPAAPSSSSKIKSAELVHSSDDSDVDAEGEPASSPHPVHRSPSPVRHALDDEDGEAEEIGGSGGLEIEVPDARPKPRPNALASLGLGQSLGLGGLGYLKSPSNGPISLASAANSVEGSPNPHTLTPRKNRTEDDGVIDFGNIGGGSEDEEDGYAEDADADAEEEEVDDRDVEPMDIGPPAQSGNGMAATKMSVGGLAVDEDEDDPLYKEMMEGLAGGDSSEESEEE